MGCTELPWKTQFACVCFIFKLFESESDLEQWQEVSNEGEVERYGSVSQALSGWWKN